MTFFYFLRKISKLSFRWEDFWIICDKKRNDYRRENNFFKKMGNYSEKIEVWMENSRNRQKLYSQMTDII